MKLQVIKKHKNSHQQYVEQLLSEGKTTDKEVDETHSRIQRILQARLVATPRLACLRAWCRCCRSIHMSFSRHNASHCCLCIQCALLHIDWQYNCTSVLRDTAQAFFQLGTHALHPHHTLSTVQEEFEKAREYKPQKADWMSQNWTGFNTPAQQARIRNTGAPCHTHARASAFCERVRPCTALTAARRSWARMLRRQAAMRPAHHSKSQLSQCMTACQRR